MRFAKANMCLVISLGLIALLTTGSVYAGGKKLYPGSNCFRANGDQPVPMINLGRLFNTSTISNLEVVCPILHTNFDSDPGNNLDLAIMGVINNNPYGDDYPFTCRRNNTFQVDAAIFGTSVTKSATYDPTHEVDIKFPGTGGGVGRNSESWYYIHCTIPPSVKGQHSGITNYFGHEY